MCSLYAINLVLLIFVLISVPAMLCTMPFIALAGSEKEAEKSSIELAEKDKDKNVDQEDTTELLQIRKKQNEDLEKILKEME